MFGLAAAPEMVIAVPSEMLLAYSALGRYPSFALPECSGVAVKERALRSCHARSWPPTRFRAILTTCNGLEGKSVILTLSSESKPVNGFALRCVFDAPR